MPPGRKGRRTRKILKTKKAKKARWEKIKMGESETEAENVGSDPGTPEKDGSGFVCDGESLEDEDYGAPAGEVGASGGEKCNTAGTKKMVPRGLGAAPDVEKRETAMETAKVSAEGKNVEREGVTGNKKENTRGKRRSPPSGNEEEATGAIKKDDAGDKKMSPRGKEEAVGATKENAEGKKMSSRNDEEVTGGAKEMAKGKEKDMRNKTGYAEAKKVGPVDTSNKKKAPEDKTMNPGGKGKKSENTGDKMKSPVGKQEATGTKKKIPAGRTLSQEEEEGASASPNAEGKKVRGNDETPGARKKHHGGKKINASSEEEASSGRTKETAGGKKVSFADSDEATGAKKKHPGVPRGVPWGDEGAPGGSHVPPFQPAVTGRLLDAGFSRGGAQAAVGDDGDVEDENKEVAGEEKLLSVIHATVATAFYSGSESEKYQKLELPPPPVNVHYGCPKEGCFVCFDNPESLQQHVDEEHMEELPLERVRELVALMCNSCIDHSLPQLVKASERRWARGRRKACAGLRRSPLPAAGWSRCYGCSSRRLGHFRPSGCSGPWCLSGQSESGTSWQ